MPFTTPDNLPYEQSPPDQPGHTLHGGTDGLQPILAIKTQEALTSIRGELVPLQLGFLFGGRVVFTSSGTFTKGNFPGLRAVGVACQGGGGGGGGTQTTTADEASSSGGGGGGVYAESFVLASALLSTETVTVGAGGAGGTAGNTGSTGGTTSFGAHAIAPGGSGGFSRGPSTGFRGSSGATPTFGGTGDLIIPGGAGGGGISFGTSVISAVTVDKGMYGAGGSSHMGATGRSARGPDTDPEPGTPYGGGGSGNVNNNSQAGKTGAAGAPGLVIVTLYF